MKGAKELDFRDIHAFDADNVVLMAAGQPARFYKTTNGGKSWKKTFEHPNDKSFFDAISFWDKKHGIAMSDPIDGHILLLETKDGGNSWTEVEKSKRPATMKGEAGFAASGTNMVVHGDSCWIALGGAEENQQEVTSRIVYSFNRGKSWDEAIVMVPRNPSSGIFSMAFSGPYSGVAVGGDYQKPELKKNNVLLTRNAGQTWLKPIGRPPRGYRSGVAFLSRKEPQKIVAVGPTGTDFSDDAGVNWKAASEIGFHAVAFTENGKAGWASGSDGRIGKWINR